MVKQQSQTSQRPELQTEYQDSVRIQISEDAEVNEEKEIMDLFQQVEQQGKIIAHGESIRIHTAPRGFLQGPHPGYLVSQKKSQMSDYRKAFNQSHFNEDIAHCRPAHEYDVTGTQQLREKTMTSFKKIREKKREFTMLPLKIQTYGEQFHLQNVRSSFRSNGSDGTSNAFTSGRTTPFLYGTRYTAERFQNTAAAQQTNSDFTNKNFVLDNRHQKKKNSNFKISEHISSINLDAEQIPDQFHPKQSNLRTQTQISKRFRGRKLLQNEHSIRYGSTNYNQFAQSCDVSLLKGQPHKKEPILLDYNNGRFKQVKMQVYSNDELNENKNLPIKIPALQRVQLSQRKTGKVKEQTEENIDLRQSLPSQQNTTKHLTLMALSMNQTNQIVLQQDPFPTKSLTQKNSRVKKLPKYDNKMNSYYQKVDRDKKVSELASIETKQQGEDQKNDLVQKYLERVKAIQKHLEIRESLIIGKAAVELRSKNDFRRQSRMPKTQGHTTLQEVNDVDLMLKMSQFIQYK